MSFTVKGAKIFFAIWLLAMCVCWIIKMPSMVRLQPMGVLSPPRGNIEKIDHQNGLLKFETFEHVQGSQQDSDTNIAKRDLVAFLTKELQLKLKQASSQKNITITGNECARENLTDPTCPPEKNGNCLREQLPVLPRARIEQLVLPENLQLEEKLGKVLQSMRESVPGNFDVVLVSALSSNHYTNMQGNLEDVHKNVLPQLTNYTFIVYDLGLTDHENEELTKHCRCQVRKFPFDRLPEHFRVLRCFSWKVFIIRAHYEAGQVIIWMDSSIRFPGYQKLPDLLKQVRERGIAQSGNLGGMKSPFHTHMKMYEFFGDSPCAHLAFGQSAGYFGAYHREPLVTFAFLQPLAACAANKECMCPMGWNRKPWDPCSGKHILGQCARDDQSAMTTILAKLFRDKYRYFSVDLNNVISVERHHEANYFQRLAYHTNA